MEAKVRVARYDPDGNRDHHFDEYTVQLAENAMVLDALIDIRENVDETLSVRCSCRSAICGSCAMRVNGKATLVCNTPMSRVAPNGEQITVEPMGNMPVLKDLVVDLEVFWNKVKAITPWIQPEGPKPEREYIVADEHMQNLINTVQCILCGACVSDCTVLEVDPSFMGPAALAKAYRFAADPRDGHKQERLELYSQASGMWDCTHCFQCVEVCPKGVAPMDWILELRREAEAAGLKDHNGVRHSESLAHSVKESGWLDEAKLAMDSYGKFSDKLKLVPVGVRTILKGKMPKTGPFHHKRPGAEHVTRIFEELEGKHS
ncbi:MAG: succinate dehydrogenase iron-sulfur subunit [Dehalococcoidia bacterium]|nr:succinate dehydrogenase iron-sulfur subunit [Dehalococcoidia bacterium]